MFQILQKCILFLLLVSNTAVSAPLCRSYFDSMISESQIIESIKGSDAFLDKRNEEWANSRRCLCCHTTLPYIMTRTYDAKSAGSFEIFRNSAVAKVQNPDLQPWYSADMTRRNSNPTESVVNAMTLLMYDQARKTDLQPVTLKAVDRIFEQLDSNHLLHWLDFNLQPFESKAAELWGNSFAILAIETAQKKSSYRAPQEKYKAMKNALLSKPEKLNLNEKSILLWAHSLSKSVLSPELFKQFVLDLKKSQNKNGSWNQKAVLNMGTNTEDTYSTSIALLALVKSKVRGKKVTAAADWLTAQQKTVQTFGLSSAYTFWPSTSMNRTDSNMNNLFASDSATGYATLALKAYKNEILKLKND